MTRHYQPPPAGLSQILSARFPAIELSLPPGHSFGMGFRSRQCFQIPRKSSNKGLVGFVRGRPEAQHGMGPGNRTVCFNISADVGFRHVDLVFA